MSGKFIRFEVRCVLSFGQGVINEVIKKSTAASG